MNRLLTRDEAIFFALFPLLIFSLFFSNATPEVFISLLNIHFLYWCFKEKNWQWLKEPLFIIATIFIVYASCRSLFADSGFKSFQSVNLLRYYLIGLSMRRSLRNEELLTKFVYLNLAVLLFASLSALTQFFTHIDFFGNAIIQGNRLTNFAGKLRIGAVLAFVSLPMILTLLKITKYKYLNLIAIFTIWLAIFASGERAALLLFSAGFILGMLIIAEARKQLLPILVAAALIFTAVSILKPEIMKRNIGQTYDHMSNYQSSEYGQVHHNAFNIVLQNPIFGVGADNYGNYCQNMASKNGKCDRHAHNIYLEIATEYGVLGLLLFMSYFVVLYRDVRIQKFNNSLLSYFMVGAISLIVIKLIPIVPSSSIFRPWVNFSLFTYAAYIYNNRHIK